MTLARHSGPVHKHHLLGVMLMSNLILLKDFLETQIELWKPIDGFLGYEVSNLGRVRSFWRKSGSGTTGGFFASGKRRGSWTYVLGASPVIRATSADKDGYRTVVLSINGETYCRRVHRLVAAAFLSAHNASATKVNHKNNVKYDNRLPNLEWCTQRENEDHARMIGVWPSGVKSGNSKVTEEQVRIIRSAAARGESNASIGRKFSITATAVQYIVNRRHYRNVS